MSGFPLQDPVLWILAAGILFGLAILFWAFGKLKEETRIDTPLFGTTPGSLGASKPKDLPFKPEVFKSAGPLTPPPASFSSTPPAPAAPFSSAPVASAPSPAAPAAPAVNPETVDKLMKIVGTVLQQVEILQKQIGGGRPK